MHLLSWWIKIREKIIGPSLDINHPQVFHQTALVAFFAWVGLGADGLSSACYGPEEAFLALGQHPFLSIFVALATMLTVLVISASYSLIIEAFPTGGGGYLVASRLLSPQAGMVCGSALIVDYLLTITISVASGMDSLFSFLPLSWLPFKLLGGLIMIGLLMFLNIRGVRESVKPLIPVFLTFVITHVVLIVYAVVTHVNAFPMVVQGINQDINNTVGEIGWLGMMAVILRAYSLGAGTYTGIEAVSNGLPLLREPRVQTGKRTMVYMAFSLAFTVTGLMIAYMIYDLKPVVGKTLNAVLFERVAQPWGVFGDVFVYVSLIAAACILFVAAQAGFLGGPRVMASMALDRWLPARFAALSDRLVHVKGVLIFGLGAMAMMMITRGSVKVLVVLYSINVFITFFLSQLGMMRHWLMLKGEEQWFKKFMVNTVGCLLTAFILVGVTVMKFHEGGGWTLVMTGLIIMFAWRIKHQYSEDARHLKRLEPLVSVVKNEPPALTPPTLNLNNTAVIVVNGFNGLGVHTLLAVMRLFPQHFGRFIFLQIGVVDAGHFKGPGAVRELEAHINEENKFYVEFVTKQGYLAESRTHVGTEVITEVDNISRQIVGQYPSAVFFGGQLVFNQESFLRRWLHNYTVFALQRKLYQDGIPFMVMPIRVQ